MDLSNPESVSIKTEPWSQEEGSCEMAYTDIEIHLPDAKKKFLQYAENVQPTSSINMKTVPTKAEQGPRKDGEVGLPYTEIDIDLPDVKKECLEYCERASDIVADLKTHPGQKTHSCSHCHYSCSYKSALTMHLRTHTREKPYSCHDHNYCSFDTSHLTRNVVTMVPSTSKQIRLAPMPTVKSLEEKNNVTDSSLNLILFSELELKDPGCWPKLSQNAINLLVQEGPVQLKDFDFPITNKRKFNTKYYYKKLPNGEELHRSWLIYSKTLDKVFCFCCKLFSVSRNGALTSSGLCDWNHLTQNLISHEKSLQHLDNFEKWKNLEIGLTHNKTVDSELQRGIIRETDKYKAILKRLIICVKYLGTQSIGFRGCTDKIHKSNNGNFLKLVESFAEIDPVMSAHLQNINEEGSTHSYLSKTIQNELISLIGREIQQNIVSMILASKYFSIIVDCTRDISRQEQLTLIIRFAYKEDTNIFSVREHFLGFLHAPSSTGLGLIELILKKLTELGLSIDFLRGQGYDNGSNMKGKKSGVQARIIEKEPRAFFVPCSCHSLNVVINDAVQSSVDAVSFFGVVQSVYVFFSSSGGRWGILKKHVKDLIVKPLCETRWSSRVDALKVIRWKLKYIVDALMEIEENDSDKYTREVAKSIASNITNFKFVCCLVVWFDVLHEINYASESLQSVEKHINSSIGILLASKEYLERYRSDESFNYVLKTAKEICFDIGIEARFIESTSTRSRLKKRMFVYEGSDKPIIDLETKFKVDFVLVVLDQAISSINERIEQLNNHFKNFSVLFNIGEFIPSDNSRESCMNLELVLTKGRSCDIKGLDLFEELTKLSTRVPKGSDCLGSLNFIIRDGLEGMFPNAYIALRILLTLPVSAASGERSISKLKLIKNYLRNSMSQERLTGLAFMSIESDICRSINYDDLITKFANAKAREVVF